MNRIVVNGDSCCHERHFAVDNSYVEKTWAYSIGATKNLSLSGASNDRIFHTTIDYLNENDVDTLIIGWTNFDRYYIGLEKGIYLNINPGMGGDDLLFGFNKSDMDHYHMFPKFYYTHCYNSYLHLQRFCNYYLHLQDYCEMKDIKFLNFMTMWPIPRNDQLRNISKTAHMSRESKDIEEQGILYNQRHIEKLYARFDKKHWVDGEVGIVMTKTCKEYPTMSDNDPHPGPEASKFWAEIIQKNL
jgi:hypothetical protein